MLWAPTHQHRPCFEFWKLRSERTKVLVILALKGRLWRMEVLVIIAQKAHLLWCCVWHLLLEKSTFFLVWFNVKPIVQTQNGSECSILSSCMDWLSPSQFSFSPWSPWRIAEFEMDSSLRARKEIQSCIRFQICWEVFPRDVMLCKNVYLNLFVEVAMMSGFLTSYFPMEPLNQVV